MKMAASLAFAFLLLAVSARASVYLGSWCDGDSLRIHVSLYAWGYPDHLVGLVVQQSWVGTCETEQIITPEPLPIPDEEFPGAETTYDLSIPIPAWNRYLRYQVLAVDRDGNLFPVPSQGDLLPYDFAICGTAVAARGFLVDYDGWLMLQDCPCWSVCGFGPVDLSALDPGQYQPYLDSGVPVDLYGDPFVDGMPGSPCLVVARMEPTPGGQCGPVPTIRSSWGALKSRYR